MLKKTITYKDLDDNDVTEVFYFNFTKAELIEMETSHKGGLESYLRDIVAAQNVGEIIRIFQEIIKKAYGVRSEDNRSFIKRPDVTEKFVGSDAYSQLFMSLVTDREAGAEFINAVMPKDLVEKAKEAAVSKVDLSTDVNIDTNKVKRIDGAKTIMTTVDEALPKDPTRDEIISMTKAELAALMRKRTQE